jgi:carboxypeptidase family protein
MHGIGVASQECRLAFTSPFGTVLGARNVTREFRAMLAGETRRAKRGFMISVGRVVLLGAILLFPMAARAQEAVLAGAIVDTTGAVLPGVTVTAIHEETGNRFVTVTDERGVYRIPARVGAYQLTAELQGFTTVTRTGLQLLVGQTASIDLQMAPSTVQETVTVTAEAPLLNVATSSLGGNIDPQQVRDLPTYGRNWMALAMLAPGSRMTNPDDATPIANRGAAGDIRQYQFNLDGQQVTSEMGFGNQPRYSTDSIGEFQYISNRFDATMGRSAAVQVIAVTKSGTNRLAGSVRGNFRNTQFNAENPVLNRVVPIDNQQFAFTLGGPIMRDRLHYFGHFEYEREPRTFIFNTPYPAFNVDLKGNDTIKMGGGRVDYQWSSNRRLMGKFTDAERWQPAVPGGAAGVLNQHPAMTGTNAETNREYLGQFTHVLSNRALNEIKVGKTRWIFRNTNLTAWQNHWQKGIGVTTGSPRITFTGFSIAGNTFYPRFGAQDNWSFRDDFTFSYDARGRHDLKTGFDAVVIVDEGNNCQACMGVIDARGVFNGQAIPSPDQLQAWFPDAWNADTWNLAAISPWVRTYSIGVGDYATHDVRPQYGGWLQDDWQFSRNLTLNLGVRYDLNINGSGNQYAVPPFVEAGRPNDTNNIQPRAGFAYKLGDRTVVRGGTGLYYASTLQIDTFFMAQITRLVVFQITNDGRPNFAADPLNGQPLPTYEQAQQQFCHVRNVPGCLRRSMQEMVAPAEFSQQLARTWQSSIGVQRQIGSTIAVEADYVYSQGRNEKEIIENMNLTYNPATGANYPFSDIARRAYPDYGAISMLVREGWSSYHALQTAVTKRLSNRWQGSATYTLSGFWDAQPRPFTGTQHVSFPTSPDMGGEFSLSASDLRHRAVLNGIWEVGRGFLVSGSYYLGVGQRAQTIYGGDLRNIAGVGGPETLVRQRLRPDGTIVPRNSFTQPRRQLVALRAQQRFIVGRFAIDGIAEAFNLFNSPNWTIETQESNRQFGQAVQAEFRRAQLGFRVTF